MAISISSFYDDYSKYINEDSGISAYMVLKQENQALKELIEQYEFELKELKLKLKEQHDE
jgi:dynactin complex subunit